jgi:hypothetical protein
MDLKKLDSKLRILVIDSITAGEKTNKDSPIEIIEETKKKLEGQIQEIESWFICESCKKPYTFGVCHDCYCERLPGDD